MNILKVSIASITAVILLQAAPVTAQETAPEHIVYPLIERLCTNKGLSASTEAICEDTVRNMANEGASVDDLIYVTRSLVLYERASQEQSRQSADIYNSVMNRRPARY
jgi:hypothetical protein